MTPFQLALGFTLPAEGGYTPNPVPTNYGIEQSTYDTWRKSKGLPSRPVSECTKQEAEDIYSNNYWGPARCHVLPTRLAVAHFDWAVNHGVVGAIMTLQQAAGVNEDGIFGPITEYAIKTSNQDVLLDHYLCLRSQDYREIAKNNPEDQQYLAGWLMRVVKLRSYLGTIHD